MTTPNRLARWMMGLTAIIAALPEPAGAQPLGTFRWQLQPFCNVVTLAVTQNGGVYRLEGTDDQCGNGADQTSAIGMAFLNPDGTIGFGFHVVTPGGQPVHVESRITFPSLNGTWRDSAGNAGTFAFTTGVGSGGSARPLPVPAVGDVTGVIAGAGLTGGGSGGDVPIAVDAAVIQNRVSGSCAAGQAVRTINENGTVACETILTAAVPPLIQLRADGGLLAGGAEGVGTIPASGPGIRMMWHPAKAAFRAGEVSSVAPTAWDDANTGDRSMAFGLDTFASGPVSLATGGGTRALGNFATAMGNQTRASGIVSTALGFITEASGLISTAMGLQTTASGDRSTAMGFQTTASGNASTAMGRATVASGTESTAMGEGSQATANNSTAIGANTIASGPNSTAMGFETTASGIAATAMGQETIASGVASLAAGFNLSASGGNSVALGSYVSASTTGTFMFGDNSTNQPMLTFTPNQFLVRAAGGVGFYSNATLTTGVELSPNANDWSSASDVRTKTAFRELPHDEVLDRIAAMPVTEWSYIAQGESTRHIGPMAQDFHAAFGLGSDPLRIGTLDAGGVALAAVRALEHRDRTTAAAQASEIDALRAIVATLTRQLTDALAQLDELKGRQR